MDIYKAIQTGYYSALVPAIGVPVYQGFAIPENVAYPYVVISSITVNEILVSGCKKYNCEVVVDVVTGFSSPKGMSQAWDISQDIQDIVNPQSMADLDITANGYEIGETRMLGSLPNQFRSDNYWIYRNIMTFSHIVVPI